MIYRRVAPTGEESQFGDEELLVTKTDVKGRITYANDTFLRVSHYNAHEVIGAPHSIIRHPQMPRCVFKLLWDTILAGHEIFAYVLNMAKNGDHYWVFAHVTPTFDDRKEIIGFHSNRRKPDRARVLHAEALYDRLFVEERRYSNSREGMSRAASILTEVCHERGLEYDEFVFSL